MERGTSALPQFNNSLVAYPKHYTTIILEHEAVFDDLVIQASSFRKMPCCAAGAKEGLLKNFKYPRLASTSDVFMNFSW
jgi:hypothetical protein